MAGRRGFEPRFTESESVVLPLNDPPVFSSYVRSLERQRVLTANGRSMYSTTTNRLHFQYGEKNFFNALFHIVGLTHFLRAYRPRRLTVLFNPPFSLSCVPGESLNHWCPCRDSNAGPAD